MNCPAGYSPPFKAELSKFANWLDVGDKECRGDTLLSRRAAKDLSHGRAKRKRDSAQHQEKPVEGVV
jgi:hypothetical protein